MNRWKSTLERIHGRKLGWDEFFQLLVAYVDLTEKSTVTWAQGEMKRLAREFEQRGLANEAHLVNLFSDLVSDVMLGKVSVDDAEDALLSPGGHS